MIKNTRMEDERDEEDEETEEEEEEQGEDEGGGKDGIYRRQEKRRNIPFRKVRKNMKIQMKKRTGNHGTQEKKNKHPVKII